MESKNCKTDIIIMYRVYDKVRKLKRYVRLIEDNAKLIEVGNGVFLNESKGKCLIFIIYKKKLMGTFAQNINGMYFLNASPNLIEYFSYRIKEGSKVSDIRPQKFYSTILEPDLLYNCLRRDYSIDKLQT